MFFHLKHIVFPVGRICRLAVEAVFPAVIDPHTLYSAEVIPFSGLRPYGTRGQRPVDPAALDSFRQKHPLRHEAGVLTLDIAFPQEDCYHVVLYVGDRSVETLEVYALEDDLFHTVPFKGDNHIHTCMSDGKESPMYMAAVACRLGYDYCVITDHKVLEPSLIARDFYEGTDVDFLVIPGEEVHSPDNPVHLINMGGTESVNDWWRDHEDEYRAAVAAEMETIVDPMTDEDRFSTAASQVMFDRIRSVDGISILCHPSWILAHGFNQHEDITDYLMDHRRFDALELIAGGAFEVGTQMQIAYYQERPKMPVLGSSDSHATFGGRLEPGNFTVAFAEELSCNGIKNAIRAGHTIAGSKNLYYGDYRLVKYGYFLNRNYYPDHDRLRASVGIRMLRMASSMQSADSDLGMSLKEIRPSESFLSIRYPM